MHIKTAEQKWHMLLSDEDIGMLTHSFQVCDCSEVLGVLGPAPLLFSKSAGMHFTLKSGI